MPPGCSSRKGGVANMLGNARVTMSSLAGQTGQQAGSGGAEMRKLISCTWATGGGCEKTSHGSEGAEKVRSEHKQPGLCEDRLRDAASVHCMEARSCKLFADSSEDARIRRSTASVRLFNCVVWS